MDNKINIAQLLKEYGVPEGTEFYSTIFGKVLLKEISELAITFTTEHKADYYVDRFGYYSPEGECVLFPSKDQRDWSKYKYEILELNVEEITKDYLSKTIRNGRMFFLFNTNLKLQAIIKMLAVANYLNDGWIADWGLNSNKFVIEFMGNTFDVLTQVNVVTRVYSNTSLVSFKTKELAEKAIEMLGEETIITALS